ncbi:hypothetical protein [Guptibacillus algicola]|uniref:hypothetical protein n=1 Tax=Guptibacillus algicola TaxID=225844 RepID=UPI001CD1D587|nr:hypothetical protein [Alkalihalobacillus algicola]MCA0986536.1 hypothetical protein [Alkalihalobacillus algicola]
MDGSAIIIVMTLFLWSITKTIVSVTEKITDKPEKQNDLLEEIKGRLDKQE